jgi:hypothetical protein
LGGNGTSSSSTSSPSVLQVDSGATLTLFTYGFFGSNTYTFADGTALQGSGQFGIQAPSYTSATVVVNTDVAAVNWSIGGGGGGNTLTGSKGLTITGQLDWTDGTMTGAGTTNVAAGATFNLSGAATKTLDHRTLNNSGTATWTGTSTGSSQLKLSSSATINNYGTWQVQQAGPSSYITEGGTINNYGTVTNISTATGASGIGSAFNNLDGGTLEVVSGKLYLGGNGTSSSGTSRPSVFQVDSGATLTFYNYSGNNTYTFASSTALQGSGQFGVQAPSYSSTTVVVNADLTAVNWAIGGGGGSNTLIVNGSVAVQNAELDDGTITGSGHVTISGGNFDWTGGTISNLTGGLDIAADGMLTIEGNGTKTLDGHTINIDGAAVWQDSGSLNLVGTNPTINVQADGSFTIVNDQTVNGNGFFNNYGTVTKNPGVGKTTIASGIAFANNGTVSVQSGWLEVDNFTQYSGLTSLNGTILGSTGTVAIYGGELAGTGKVQANVTVDLGGVVSPGGDGNEGELTIEGNYTQKALGVLNLDIAGAVTPGVDYDWLNVTGNATLDGTLNVNFLYSPTIGDSYKVLTAKAVSGTFAQFNVFNLDPNLKLATAYNSADATLTVTSSTRAQGSSRENLASGAGMSAVTADAYFGMLRGRHDATLDDLDFVLS